MPSLSAVPLSPPARRILAGSTAVAAVFALAGATGATAQTTSTTLVPVAASVIDVTVAIGGALPPGVTGYRLDTTCRGVAGIPAGTPQVIPAQFPKTGGKATVTVYLLKGANCAFRFTVLGTGPRPLSGNVIVVGGQSRKVTFPQSVDGVAVDAFTVIETDAIALEASTSVVIGQDPATTTTVAPTTTTAATTTAGPTTAAPTTAVAAPTTTSAPVTAPPTTVATVALPAATPTTKPAVATGTAKPVKKKATRLVCTGTGKKRRCVRK